MKLLVMQLSSTSHHSIPLWSKYSPQHPVLKQGVEENIWTNTLFESRVLLSMKVDISTATVMTLHSQAVTNISRNAMSPFLSWRQRHNLDADNIKIVL
jgi:hypothetical protein